MNWESELTKKYIAEASVYEAILLGAGKNVMYRIYELKCGHEQEIKPGNMRTGKFHCKTCINNQHIADAKAQEATLLGPGKNANFRTYKLKCQHEQEIAVGEMKRGKLRCNTCLNNKHIADAKTQRATLLGAGRNAHHRIYKLKCGHEQEIQLSNMRIGQFRCNTCEESAHTLPSNVYLLLIERDGEQWLKLGYAKSVDTRAAGYGLLSDAVVTDVVVTAFATGADAREYEEALHAQFKRKKLSKKRAKELGMACGFTECYPVTMLDTLAAELAA